MYKKKSCTKNKFFFAEVCWREKVGNWFCITFLHDFLLFNKMYTFFSNTECFFFLYKSVGEKSLKTNFVQIVWRTKVENDFCTDCLANKSWKRILYRSSGKQKLKTIFVQIVWRTKVENDFCTDLLANKSWKRILYRSSGEQKLKTIFAQIVWQTKVGNNFCTDLLANKSWKQFLYRLSGEQKLKTNFVEMVWRKKVENNFCYFLKFFFNELSTKNFLNFFTMKVTVKNFYWPQKVTLFLHSKKWPKYFFPTKMKKKKWQHKF